MKDIVGKIKNIIECLGVSFKKDKTLILTEGDLQWQICYYLQTLKRRCDKNNEYSIHTEVSWYEKEDEKKYKLVYRPDISLIPIKDIKRVGESKGFYFAKDGLLKGIVMELKFFRGSKKASLITENKKEQIKKDIEKMSNLKALNPQVHFFLIIF